MSEGSALTSAGGGVRLFLFDDWQADIGVAVPLELSRARQFKPQRAAAVLALQRVQALPGTADDKVSIAACGWT